jgi:hypothetical protein
MNVRHRCECNPAHRDQHLDADPKTGKESRGLFRRASDLMGWLVPAALLALMPKCPLCIAAYIALGTGIGISVATAAYLRFAMIGMSLAALAFLATRGLRRATSARLSKGAIRWFSRCCVLRQDKGELSYSGSSPI